MGAAEAQYSANRGSGKGCPLRRAARETIKMSEPEEGLVFTPAAAASLRCFLLAPVACSDRVAGTRGRSEPAAEDQNRERRDAWEQNDRIVLLVGQVAVLMPHRAPKHSLEGSRNACWLLRGGSRRRSWVPSQPS